MITEFIANIPKAELLVHLEGTLEPALLLELALRNNVTLPYVAVEEVKKSYHFTSLQSFLTIYYENLRVLVKEQDFYDLTLAYLTKAASQQVRHVEITFDPQAHLARGISFLTVITGIHRAMLDAGRNLKISSHLIMSFLRDLSVEAAEQLLLQSFEFKDWITAVGLDSAEMNNPPEKFQAVFDRAREYGYFTVASAGEEGPPEYIWQALDVLKVSRIGYAVRCLEDPDLVNRLALSMTPLTICPVSNVKLCVVKSMRDHPLKKMLEQGLCVTINSDDPAYFDAYLNENFLQASASLKFTKAQIYEMAKNSFMASFLDNDKKELYIAELDKFYKQNCP
ncbi:MAG: adenosine deaminase [Pseudomonadota bacterium]